MAKNPSHYSLLKYTSPQVITQIQTKFGAKVYFNSLIPFVDENGVKRLIKYGVIDKKNFINDLLDWDYLYVSGRLHKPVKIIHSAQQIAVQESISKALGINHQNALYSSLLLLSDHFSEEQLYLTIAGLSYSGDFRMYFGEDKNKVTKIVVPNIERFRNIYQPYIDSLIEKGLLSFSPASKMYRQDLSPRVILHNLSLLPKKVQQNLYLNFDRSHKLKDLDDVLMSISKSHQCSQFVKQAIDKIVWLSSWSQSLKGILTAGFFKSFSYSSSKIAKMMR